MALHHPITSPQNRSLFPLHLHMALPVSRFRYFERVGTRARLLSLCERIVTYFRSSFWDSLACHNEMRNNRQPFYISLSAVPSLACIHFSFRTCIFAFLLDLAARCTCEDHVRVTHILFESSTSLT